MSLIKGLFGGERRSMENPAVPLSDGEAVQALFESWGGRSESGVKVTTEKALSVPAVFAASNFIAGTMASLPLHIYDRDEEKGRIRHRGDLDMILSKSPAPGWTSFAFFQYGFEQVLTEGRFVAFIEKNVLGRVINLWPLETAHVTVERQNGLKRYIYQDGTKRVVYNADEVIDIPFSLKSDQVTARNPIKTLRNTIGLAISVENYAARFFGAGGVPPLALTGPFQSPKGVERASNDVWSAVKRLVKQRRNILTLPLGHELKAVGVDPEKGQLIEVRRFMVEELSRLYSLPPVFIQDLTHGTFSNTEQQDLHFVKHTIRRWVVAVEQELNLKLFNRRNRTRYIEYELDGLLRGEFATRMSGYATAIQNGILKPNEAREAENRPRDEKGDTLMIQGATVPMGMQPTPAQAEKRPNDG